MSEDDARDLVVLRNLKVANLRDRTSAQDLLSTQVEREIKIGK